MQRRHRIEKCLGADKGHEAFCPYCYENRKQRGNHKGHRYYVSTPTRKFTHWSDIMKRPSQATRPKKGEYSCPDAAFASTYPILAAGMCDPWWDDGKPRKCWTLKVAMQEDVVLLTLNDPDLKMVAFTSAPGLTEGLMEIEAALEGTGLSWRKSRW